MFFVPYKLNVDIDRWPVITFLIIALCLAVFYGQVTSRIAYSQSVKSVCGEAQAASVRDILSRVNHEGLSCPQFWQSIKESADPEQTIRRLAEGAGGLDHVEERRVYLDHYYTVLLREYHQFNRVVPPNLTDRLFFDPDDPSLFSMITSSFSHGSLGHVLGNVIAFYAFASGIEIIVGSATFLVLVLVMSVSTSLAYQMSVAGLDVAMPTHGLSGVVMGMLGMLVVLVPKARIKCFLWFIFIFKRLYVPVVFLAVGYIGWDLYSLHHERDSMINYVGHVSGACAGLFIAVVYRIARPGYIRNLTDP
ncbi:MAG: rhomboid family intramembrane serine protease [Pseudomonadota bacterium]